MGSSYLLRGVPHHKEDTYQLAQFHFHFGRNDREGSEHTLDWEESSGEVSQRICWVARVCVMWEAAGAGGLADS